MPDELVPVPSGSRQPELIAQVTQSATFPTMAGVLNTPATLSRPSLAGTSAPAWSASSAAYQPIASPPPRPSCRFGDSYNPLGSLAAMVNTFSPDTTPSRSTLIASQLSSSRSAPQARYSMPPLRDLINRNPHANTPDIRRSRCNSMLHAAIKLRYETGLGRTARDNALGKVSSVYEEINGWGLLPINRRDIADLLPDDRARDNFVSIREKVSEKVMVGIHHDVLNSASPVSLQQRQYADIVKEVYEEKRQQALQRLNTRAGASASGLGGRLRASSTRALDRSLGLGSLLSSTPDITLNVQCGEQVALIYALLQKQSVAADQLRMVTFSNGYGSNHCVLLYGYAPSCQLDTLTHLFPASGGQIQAVEFYRWLFEHRQGLFILDPWSQDRHGTQTVDKVPYNSLMTNKCIDFAACRSAEQLREGINFIMAQAGVVIEDMEVSMDYPLADIYQAALKPDSSEAYSEQDTDTLDSHPGERASQSGGNS